MTKPLVSVLLLVIVVVMCCLEHRAQSVPASVRRDITNQLKRLAPHCAGQYASISIDVVKVGPRKYGYIGDCRYGGGPSILVEKTPKGIRQLLTVDVGMNGYFYPEKTAHNGYYDMAHTERSGEEVFLTVYRWNGSRYVAQREQQVR